MQNLIGKREKQTYERAHVSPIVFSETIMKKAAIRIISHYHSKRMSVATETLHIRDTKNDLQPSFGLKLEISSFVFPSVYNLLGYDIK